MTGAPELPLGYMGTTFPNLDPPDPNDDNGFQDLIYLSASMPLTFDDSWSGGCGSGTQTTALSGPFVHGIDILPACVPAGVDTADPYYEPGWQLVGIWNQGAKDFDFACSSTVPVTDGSQSFTVGGTIAYDRAIP
jgi:hypothetical protein